MYTSNALYWTIGLGHYVHFLKGIKQSMVLHPICLTA